MADTERHKPKESTGIELQPDGWDRLAQAVDAAKSGPKHREPKPAKGR